MSDAPSTIGHYSVVREIGRGGMGVVYLARDPNLQRDVAVKTLPPDFAENPERLARFEREARLLASLSHGNIAAVHGLESRDGARSLVMEFVPGETLSAALASGGGPLGVESSLRVCAQIAAALEAAHDAGVIHRDIKPGNVIVRPDGVVKVLDFGLAREHGGGGSSSSIHATGLPTRTMDALTGRHVVIGTPGYMSPEQARGKPLDKRTDVFSFGCVLYECLTGRNAFTGETTTDVVAAVLEAEPDWAALPARTPTRIRELLRHCLEKDPARRLRDMGDARLEIERAIAGSEWSSTSLTGAPAAPAVRWKRIAPWLVAVVAVALAAGAFVLRPRAGAPAGTTVAASILAGKQFIVWRAELSPDGKTVVYRGSLERSDESGSDQRGWWVRSLDSYTSRVIPGTQRAGRGSFSPDGQWFIYSVPSPDGAQSVTLYKASVTSSASPVAVADVETRWMSEIHPAWLDDGTIAVIVRMPEATVRLFDHRGGAVRDIPIKVDAGAVDFGQVRAVPGDPSRVFLTITRYVEGRYVLDACGLELETGRLITLIENAGLPALLRPDLLLVPRADTLLAAAFNPETFVVIGSPVAVLSGLRTQDTWSHAEFSLSDRGDLLHLPGAVSGASLMLVAIEPDGAMRPLLDAGRSLDGPIAVSPDGSRIAASLVQSGGLIDIWVMDVDRPVLRRVAATPDADYSIPCWGADNRTLYFARRGLSEGDGLYAVDVDSGEAPRLVYSVFNPQSTFVVSLSLAPTDGRLVATMNEQGRYRALLIDPNAGDTGSNSEPVALLEHPNFVSGAQYSHDGALLTYSATESGRSEVYVRPVRPNGTLGAATVVSPSGGNSPFWGSSENEGEYALNYMDANYRLVSSIIRTTPRLTVSAPTTHPVDTQRLYSVMRPMPDGRALGVLRSDDDMPTRDMSILFNASEMLRARAVGARQ